MTTRQQILDDVDLRYRNTFTDAQKIVWANDGERMLFEIFEIESPPYNFTTVEDTFFYPIPSTMDIEKIKTVSIQINDGDPATFQELPFKRNDDRTLASISSYWYSIVQNNFYVNVPGGTIDDRNVYVYFDEQPTAWLTTNLSSNPTTPEKFIPILKLYLLEQIAAARKDGLMKNNFAAEKEQLISDFEWNMKMAEPEFVTPSDMLPYPHRNRASRRTQVITITSS